MGSNGFEVKLYDRSNDRYSFGVLDFRAKGWYPVLHSSGLRILAACPVNDGGFVDVVCHVGSSRLSYEERSSSSP